MAAFFLTATLLPAFPARAAALVVTSAADSDDGICDASCTIRDAFTVANATGGPDSVTFAQALNGTPLASSVELATVGQPLTLTGNGTASTVVGNTLTAHTGGTLTVSGLRVLPPNLGFYGLLAVSGGTLVASGVTVTGDVAADSRNADMPVALTLTNSTLITSEVHVNAGTTGVTSGTFTNVTVGGPLTYNSGTSGQTTGSLTNVDIAEFLDINSGGQSTTDVTVNDVTVADGYLNANSGGTSVTELTGSGVTVSPGGMGFSSQPGTQTVSTTTVNLTDVHMSGGGILGTNGTGADVVLSDATFTGSTNRGVWHHGQSLSLDKTTISNAALMGVYVGTNGENVSITDSTIAGNGQAGIVIDYPGASVDVVNSTVSGNAAGVTSTGTLDIANTTITANAGSGLVANAGTSTITNTIVADNAAVDCVAQNTGIITSGGHNVVGAAAPACGTSAAGDQVVADAQLGALGDNGGPTHTHLPAAGSAVLDAGLPSACPAVDQRGVARPQDDDDDGTAVCDVGAVEGASAPTANTPPVVNAGTDKAGAEGSAVPLNGTVTETDGDLASSLWTVAPSGPVDVGAQCTIASPPAAATTVTCNDDGTFVATLKATDNDGESLDTVSVQIANAKPSLNLTAPANYSLYKPTASIGVSGTLADAGSNDTRGCKVAWGDGSTSTAGLSRGVCAPSHTYAAPGVYAVKTRAVDDDGGASAAVTRYVVVCKNTPPLSAATVSGSAGNDVLCGGPGADSIAGAGGIDRIFGAGGNDSINGAAGDDWLYGGLGADLLTGGLGVDRMYGEAGNDTLLACDAVKDFVYGGAGTDTARRTNLDAVSGIETFKAC